MTVEADLFSRVSGYAGFTSLAGTRLYYIEAPQNVTLPYATYTRISSRRASMMGVDSGVVWARFQFDAWASNPNTSRALLEQMRAALQRYGGTGTVTIDDIYIENDLDLPREPDVKVYHSTMDAIVIYRE